jgi:hypothetical protein
MTYLNPKITDPPTILHLVGPFVHPCTRPTPASQAREPDSPPGISGALAPPGRLEDRDGVEILIHEN